MTHYVMKFENLEHSLTDNVFYQLVYLQVGGNVLASDYPYTATNGVCKLGVKKYPTNVHPNPVSQVYQLDLGSSEDYLKNTLATVGKSSSTQRLLKNCRNNVSVIFYIRPSRCWYLCECKFTKIQFWDSFGFTMQAASSHMQPY